jgi:hypothetical protein
MNSVFTEDTFYTYVSFFVNESEELFCERETNKSKKVAPFFPRLMLPDHDVTLRHLTQLSQMMDPAPPVN